MTGTIEIEIWDKMFHVESIDSWSKYSRNMPVSEFLSDNCTIFTFHKSIVCTLSCSTLSLRNSGFSSVLPLVVDELTSIVRMKIFISNGKVASAHLRRGKRNRWRFPRLQTLLPTELFHLQD